jgi:hypothetical protein
MAKLVKSLSAPEAAYLAGLIDGEGSITLSRKHRGENRQLVVSISNTDRRLLEWVVKTVGSGWVTSKCTRSVTHTPSYAYKVANTQALDLLGQICSYLQTYKKARAELVLAKYKALTPRNGRYSTELLANREQFVQEFLAIKGRSTQQCVDENGAHIGEA